MDAEDRFFVAITKRADEKLHENGTIYFNLGELEQIARELDVPDTIGRQVLRQLDDNFLRQAPFRGAADALTQPLQPTGQVALPANRDTPRWQRRRVTLNRPIFRPLGLAL